MHGRVCIFHYFSLQLCYPRWNSATDMFRQRLQFPRPADISDPPAPREHTCACRFAGPEARCSPVPAAVTHRWLVSRGGDAWCRDRPASGSSGARDSGLAHGWAPSRPPDAEATTHRRQKTSPRPAPRGCCAAVPGAGGVLCLPEAFLGGDTLLCSCWPSACGSVAGCLAQYSCKVGEGSLRNSSF